uniref:Uncharacterized protein n=1 Tax=Plectus sambesii TaxID=2011161 RepID=A0A914VB33_9BILA
MSETDNMLTERFMAIQQWPRREMIRRPRSPVARYLEKLVQEQERQAAKWSEERSSDTLLKEDGERKSGFVSDDWQKQ